MAGFKSVKFTRVSSRAKKLYGVHLKRLLRRAGRFILAIGNQGDVPAVAAVLLGHIGALQGMRGNFWRIGLHSGVGTACIPGISFNSNMAVAADAQNKSRQPAVQQQEVKDKNAAEEQAPVAAEFFVSDEIYHELKTTIEFMNEPVKTEQKCFIL